MPPTSSPAPTRAHPAAHHVVLTATDSPAAAAAGLSLYTPCHPTAVGAHHLVVAAARAGATRAVTREARADVPWLEVLSAATTTLSGLGRPDTFALHLRRGDRAGGGGLLLAGGRPLAFVRVDADHDAAEREQRALAVLAGGDGVVHVPAPLGAGRVGPWSWTASSPLPGRPHRPEPRPDLDRVHALLQRLARVVPRPDDTPDHWVVVHGDLAPWNLRRVLAGGTWLLDLDDVTWGPPDADAVLWSVATAHVRRRRRRGPETSDEARAYWRERLGTRAAAGDGVAADMLARL
ncbi:MAG: phosphotransferase [Actinomycetes bacterium]